LVKMGIYTVAVAPDVCHTIRVDEGVND